MDIAFFLSQIVFPAIGIVVALLVILVFLRSQSFRIKAGSIEVSALNREETQIRQRIDHDLESAGPSERQFALLKEYHTQGLAQSKVSFWFSLMFAALGFLIILYSVIFYIGLSAGDLGASSLGKSIMDDVQKPIFALVAGTIVEAVAALFFVQSNKARQLMVDFFDKARLDRKLDEALVLSSQIEDVAISAKLKAYLAMTFAGVEPSSDLIRSIMKEEQNNQTEKNRQQD